MLTLAVAAPAGAQSAGDEEYQNPLTGSEPAAPEPAPTQDDAPAAAPAQAAEPQAAQPHPAAAPARAGELPRTGLPAGLVAGAGALLITGGAALRRKT